MATDQLVAAAGPPAQGADAGAELKVELQPPRSKRLVSLTLANPLKDPAANASVSTLVTTASAVALERVMVRHPDLDQSAAYRLIEWIATSILEAEKTIYLHEGGHARVIAEAGGHPDIDMGFGKAVTWFNFEPGERPDPKRMADISGAGITQVSLNARDNYIQWARHGDAYYQEAAAYVFESMHAALYAGRSLLRGGDAPAGDDVRDYVIEMERAGVSLSRGQVFAVGLATALASSPNLWSATAGQWRFLLDGKRRGNELPAFKIGDTTFTWPHFYTAVSGAGLFAGGTFAVNPDKKLPLTVDLLARVDDWSAAAAKVQLCDMPLASDWLAVSPFFGMSIDPKQGLGGTVGAEVVATKGDAELGVTVAARHRDLYGAATAEKTSGLTLGVRVGWRF
ncbi:MAG: hypothetical protein HY903_18680 [Deltaproteobacteria bacterium]|nr:hypothetical protein [Deltaproteobacteria bacterium]